MRASHADRALCVEKGNRRPSLWQAVFEDNTGDAVTVQPIGDAVPLSPRDQPAVTTTGADDQRGAIRLCRAVQGDCGISSLEVAAANWRVILPEGDFLRLGTGVLCGGGECDDGDEAGEEEGLSQ
jgi:hypothetical protein